MSEELVSLLQRQLMTLELLESRLRALELLVAADEQRFVATALDELEAASERLAALELARVLTLSGVGVPPEVAAQDLVTRKVAPDLADRFAMIVDGMRLGVTRVKLARERVLAVIAPGADGV